MSLEQVFFVYIWKFPSIFLMFISVKPTRYINSWKNTCNPEFYCFKIILQNLQAKNFNLALS